MRKLWPIKVWKGFDTHVTFVAHVTYFVPHVACLLHTAISLACGSSRRLVY